MPSTTTESGNSGETPAVALVACRRGPLRLVALIEGGVLVEVLARRTEEPALVGSLRLGRVVDVHPALGIAHVEVGLARPALLSFRDVPVAVREQGRRAPVRPGQRLVVEVVRPPAGPSKGARVSADPALRTPGFAWRPLNERWEGPEPLRTELARALGGGGRVRGALGAAAAAKASWVRAVRERWKNVQERLDREVVGAELAPGPDLVEVALGRATPTRVVRAVADAAEGDALRRALALWECEPERGVEVFDSPPSPLGRFGHDATLRQALRRKVWLRGGGFLLFERTEAGTLVDVNSGKDTGSGADREASLLRLNQRAALEIARQLRLRNVGGLVVVDFVTLRSAGARRALVRSLEAALSMDAAHIRTVPAWRAGVVCLTRQALPDALASAFEARCPCCERPRPSVPAWWHAEDVLDAAALRAEGARRVAARVAPAVAQALAGRREALAQIERRTGATLTVVPEEERAVHAWEVATS